MNLQDFFLDHTAVEDFLIAKLSETDRILLGATHPTVWLSRQSLEEHKLKHPEIGVKDYAKIQDILNDGEIYRQNNKRFVLLYLDGVLYRAAIKVTANADRIYLLTLFKTAEEKAMREVKKKLQRIR